MVSRTAVSMALFRALESAKSTESQLFDDPLAIRCLPRALGCLVHLAHIEPLRRVICRLIDRRYPGARTSGVSRTRVIDVWLSQCVRRGAEQILFLGAGFDARAYRLPDLAGVAIFEMDRAEIIAAKARIASDIYADASIDRRTIAVDFLKDDIGEKLLEAGFDTGKPSVVVWEGVTNYLNAQSVSKTLSQLAACCAAGSHLIFTYVEDSVLHKIPSDKDSLRLHRRLNRWGERWTFGIDPRETQTLLHRHGFSMLRDMSANEYRHCAYGAKASELTGYEFYRLAECVVDANEQTRIADAAS